MSQPVPIRAAIASDAPVIIEFNQALASETEGRRLDPGRIEPGVRAVLADPSKGVYWVAIDGDRVIGQLLLTYEWSDWRNGTFWWIQSVYVAPDRRRQGVFRALYHHVVELARCSPGVCGLRLYMEHSNDTASRTYHQLGFQRAGYEVFEIDFTSPSSQLSPS